MPTELLCVRGDIGEKITVKRCVQLNELTSESARLRAFGSSFYCLQMVRIGRHDLVTASSASIPRMTSSQILIGAEFPHPKGAVRNWMWRNFQSFARLKKAA